MINRIFSEKCFLSLGIIFLCIYCAIGQTTLIDYGSIWKYSDLGFEPLPQGMDEWESNGYDDSGWSMGPAQLGYGDGDEATVIGDTVITAYFRQEFTVANPSLYTDIKISLIYDDGAAIYLNGFEIWRPNIDPPPALVEYDTLANAINENTFLEKIVSNSGYLIAGTNVLAVEMHQRDVISSDISFDLKLSGLASIYVTRGPYLQQLSTNSVVVRWRTNSATTSKVAYGTAINQINQSVSSGAVTTEHELLINGLSANQKYYYTIGNLNTVILGPDVDQYWKTAPPTGSTQKMVAWILGDCGTGNANARAVRDAYHNYAGSNHTDMILFLGDNAYHFGTDSEYQGAVFDTYDEKLQNTVAFSARGNHENSTGSTIPYYDIFTFPTAAECGGVASGTEAYYSFDYGNAHFISLESFEVDRSVNGAMYNWCKSDLQNTTADWIVAFWHHPPYSKGSHDSDNETRLIQMRQNFLPLLDSFGVDLVLTGHSHSYERSYYIRNHYGHSSTFNSATHTVGANGDGDGRIGGDGAYEKDPIDTSGAVYVVTGSAGKVSGGNLNHPAMFLSVSELGSSVLDIEGGTLKLRFLRENGSVQDSFTIEKDLSCTIGAPCDDGDFCTNNDVYDSNCNCVGTPVGTNTVLTLTAADSPLEGTYKATQSITVSGAVTNELQQLTTLISPMVVLDPAFEVPINSELMILQSGCN